MNGLFHFLSPRFCVTLILTLVLTGQPVSATVSPQVSLSPTHIVRYGETLSEIAQAYGLPMAELMSLNSIADADTIYVGQTLYLPAALVDSAPVPETGHPVVRSLSTTLNRTYTVTPGDTLGWIALRFGVDLDALRAINGLDLPDADRISVGQTLLLPATETELRVTRPSRQHAVKPGESLGLIAQAYGLSLAELMAANRVGNPDVIRIGQTLTIPGRAVGRAAPQVGLPRRGFRYHRVQSGDTLSQLAQTYDSTPQAIAKYNNLPDAETVYTGLEVRIPFGPPLFDERSPASRLTGTHFLISISRQRCWVFQGDRVVYAWVCSTGQGKWVTRTGTFPVKTRMEMASSSAYRLDMPYWLGLYDVGEFENGIHGIPVVWDTGKKLWTELVGQPATFGCAMLLDEDAARLFELAYLGMPVHIVD